MPFFFCSSNLFLWTDNELAARSCVSYTFSFCLRLNRVVVFGASQPSYALWISYILNDVARNLCLAIWHMETVETYEMPENARPGLLQSKVCHIKPTRRKKEEVRERKTRTGRRVSEMRELIHWHQYCDSVRWSVHRQACDECGGAMSFLFLVRLFIIVLRLYLSRSSRHQRSTPTVNTRFSMRRAVGRLSGNASYLFKVYSKTKRDEMKSGEKIERTTATKKNALKNVWYAYAR